MRSGAANSREAGVSLVGVVVSAAMLAILTVGFCAGLLYARVSPVELVSGLVPRFEGAGSVMLAASMLGATVMPHAVYLHSALARDRHGDVPASGGSPADPRATKPRTRNAMAPRPVGSQRGQRSMLASGPSRGRCSRSPSS